jgi:hypothetical protein
VIRNFSGDDCVALSRRRLREFIGQPTDIGPEIL